MPPGTRHATRGCLATKDREKDDTAEYATRIPAGHREGYEAFAQRYSDLAEQITARLEVRAPDACAPLVSAWKTESMHSIHPGGSGLGPRRLRVDRYARTTGSSMTGFTIFIFGISP
jgi:hypothetical protein